MLMEKLNRLYGRFLNKIIVCLPDLCLPNSRSAQNGNLPYVVFCSNKNSPQKRSYFNLRAGARRSLRGCVRFIPIIQMTVSSYLKCLALQRTRFLKKLCIPTEFKFKILHCLLQSKQLNGNIS